MTDQERAEIWLKLADIRENIFGARTHMTEVQRDINILLEKRGMDDKVMLSLSDCFNQIQLAFERMGCALIESYKAEKEVMESDTE